jgi:hypothetical protein
MTSEAKDPVKELREQIFALADAIQKLNNYGARLASIQAICSRILEPDPDQASAVNDLAALQASLQRRGHILSVICDWDAEWHFVFQFRFTDSYGSYDGFDLRQGKPGYAALLKALDSIKVAEELCDLTPPEPASNVPARRVIFPKIAPAKAPVEVKSAV